MRPVFVQFRCEPGRTYEVAEAIYDREIVSELYSTSGDYDLDWHPAPRRQYIVNLDAGAQITAGDGEVREIKAGEIILVEDISGKGHLSKSVGGKLRHSLFIPIE